MYIGRLSPTYTIGVKVDVRRMAPPTQLFWGAPRPSPGGRPTTLAGHGSQSKHWKTIPKVNNTHTQAFLYERRIQGKPIPCPR